MGSPLPDSPAYRGPLPPGFEPPTSGKAIGSLICGIFCFFLPASLIAVILGHLSLSEIRKSAGRLKGQGLATTGLILGYLGIALIPFLLIIAAIANLLRSKMAANEASAVGSLRTLNTAAIRYALQCPDFGFPASVENLGPGSGIARTLICWNGLFTFLNPLDMATCFSIGRCSMTGRVTSGNTRFQPIRCNRESRATDISIPTKPALFELRPRMEQIPAVRHFSCCDSVLFYEALSLLRGPNK
jgi:Domain of unknown function (DUF4190)